MGIGTTNRQQVPSPLGLNIKAK